MRRPGGLDDEHLRVERGALGGGWIMCTLKGVE